jgi:hypothetical protein
MLADAIYHNFPDVKYVIATIHTEATEELGAIDAARNPNALKCDRITRLDER